MMFGAIERIVFCLPCLVFEPEKKKCFVSIPLWTTKRALSFKNDNAILLFNHFEGLVK